MPVLIALLPILIVTSAASETLATERPSIAWLDAVQFNNAPRDRSTWRRVEPQLKSAVEESGWSWLPTPPELRPSKDCESSVACLLKHAQALGVPYLLVTGGGFSAAQGLTDFSGSVRLFHVKAGFVSEEQEIECIVCGQAAMLAKLRVRVENVLAEERQRIEKAAVTVIPQPQDPQREARQAPQAAPSLALPTKPAPAPADPSPRGANILGWSSVAVGVAALSLGGHWLLLNDKRSDDCSLESRTCGRYSTTGIGWGAVVGGAALVGTGIYLLTFHDASVSVSLQLDPHGGSLKGAF